MLKVDRIADAILDWVRSQSSIQALALVGSHARGDAQPDSDIDFLTIAIDPVAFKTAQWNDLIPWPDMRLIDYHDEQYGIVWSRRFLYEPACEIELSFGPLSWAAIDPIDAGTRRVVSNGFRILYDPHQFLKKLRDECV